MSRVGSSEINCTQGQQQLATAQARGTESSPLRSKQETLANGDQSRPFDFTQNDGNKWERFGAHSNEVIDEVSFDEEEVKKNSKKQDVDESRRVSKVYLDENDRKVQQEHLS